MNLALRALPITLLFALPLAVHAQDMQASDEMKAAVMAQLLHDPRTAQLPPEQLQQLVDSLAQQAQAQNISLEDLRFQPGGFATPAAADTPAPQPVCAGDFFGCGMSYALGFIGDNPTLPLYFLVTSGLLILLIVRMKRHHHAMGHFDTPAASASTAAQPVSPQQGTYV